MSAQSPYAPPAAQVSDPVQAFGPRPRAVAMAAACVWVSLVVGLAATAPGMVDLLARARTGAIPMVTVATSLGTTVIGFALLAFIALKLTAGRGWVRWLYVAIYAFGLVSFVAIAVLMPQALGQMASWVLAASIFNWAVQGAALVLMFVRPSREWFASKK